MIRIRETLHQLFRMKTLMEIMRGYIIGGIVACMDIFEGIPFSSDDIYIYRLLYSISEANPSSTTSAASVMGRFFTDIVDGKGNLLQISMLGEEASDSIHLRYHYMKEKNDFIHDHATCPSPFRELHQLEADTILSRGKMVGRLVSEYGMSHLDAMDAYRVGMGMKHDELLIWNKKCTVPLYIRCLIFVDPSIVHLYFNHLSRSFHEKRDPTDIELLERCLNMNPEMMKIFHKTGLLMIDSERMIRDLSSVGDAKFVRDDEDYVKKRLWIPMRYMLRIHARVVEEGKFSSTVEYGGRRYKMGIADGREVKLRRGRYTQPLYEFVDPSGERSVSLYETMLLASALRFTPETPFSENNAISRIGGLYKDFFGCWEDHREILSGKGQPDLIRDFIVPNFQFPCY